MNRRRFLELMGMTVAAGTIAYSFPSIIVPQNLVELPPYSALMHARAVELTYGAPFRKQGYGLASVSPEFLEYSEAFLRQMFDLTSHATAFEINNP